MIACPGCGNQVSEMAAACPKCGEPIKARGSHPLVYLIVTVLFMAIVIMAWAIIGQHTG